MNRGNPYQQYGYDHFPPASEEAPTEAPRAGVMERVLGSSMSAKLRNPLFATIALLAVGAAFAAVIVLSYPGGDSEDVPVIKAETTAFKEVPASPGGMDVPFQDSTIFTGMRVAGDSGERPVENLLEPEQEEPVDRFAEFAQEAEQIMDITADVADTEPAAGAESAADTATSAKNEVTNPEATETRKPVEVQQIVQKIEKIPPQDLAAKEEPARPQKLHAPGSSPETLAFVRSVLDKKDTKATTDETTAVAAAPSSAPTEEVARSVARIEPAAGAAIGAGSYYVQLGSVTSQAGAETEWGKLQKKYTTELSQVSHRIQEANLGERGTYYRIQAGPMSKESAAQICDSIKAQKPGGCLVTK